MRLYKGKMLRRGMDRRVSGARELRDGIIWDIDYTDHFCRVKIQGSDTLIKAHFQENWEMTPQWLKPGNAVRIQHPGGNRSGRIEVAGHGFKIPSPMPGGSGQPPVSPGENSVLSGCQLIASEEDMSVFVQAGTYRLNGVVYTLTGIVPEMDDETLMMDNQIMEIDSLTLGTAVIVFLDPASSSSNRYDLIVAGTDGLVHFVKGSYSGGEPTMPQLPADHLLLGYVLVHEDATTINAWDLNKPWGIPYPQKLLLSVTPDPTNNIHQSSNNWQKSFTFNLTLWDQYDQRISGTYELMVHETLSMPGVYEKSPFAYSTMTLGGVLVEDRDVVPFNGSISGQVKVYAITYVTAEYASQQDWRDEIRADFTFSETKTGLTASEKFYTSTYTWYEPQTSDDLDWSHANLDKMKVPVW